MNAEAEVREMAQIMEERRGQLKSKGGRPNKFTFRRVMRVLRYLSDGSPTTIAAEAAGIAHHTWSDWCEKFPKLQLLANRAENKGAAEMTREVRYGVDIKGNPDWKARMALLERRWRAIYGPPKAEAVTLNMTTNNNMMIVGHPQAQTSVQSLHEAAMSAMLEQKSAQFPQLSRPSPAHPVAEIPAEIVPKPADPRAE